MINQLFLFILLFHSLNLFANKPAGFLWYNLEKEKHQSPQLLRQVGKSFKQLSFSDQDAILRFYTMEALHKARATHSVADMKVFLSLQDYWLKESTLFANNFKKTLLLYPQYDYTVTHPTSNLGTKLMDNARERQRQRLIHHLAKTHGLLFFYRGANPYDQKQIPILQDFCQRFHFVLIPVSVDGASSEELALSRLDKGEADALGVHYFPAVILVNPQTKKTTPLAYGFTTQDTLEKRLFFVANGFQGESA